MQLGHDYFKDKKVTVMGLGLLGRGIGDAAFIAEAGAAEVLVTDVKTEEQLAESVAKLREYKNVQFVLGEHRNQDFVDRDLILVAAGVPMNSPYLKVANGAGVPLKQSAALFAELAGVPVIGVTGTRGKSTVTQMIHHVLRYATGEDILLGGNIRGVSNLQLLKQVTDASLCVMELDSWQLQGWGWAKRSPQIAVFTNFMEDHLNYYRASGETKQAAMAAYFADKANIFRYQDDAGVLVTTPEVFQLAETYASDLGVTIGQEVVLADASVIPEDCLLAMPGEHNRLNAALAYEALKATSLSDEAIFEGLATFPGVEGRLQLVRTVNNVRIYNDNNATTPAATVAALQALDVGNQNVILIAGGADKNIALESLVAAIGNHCKQVVLLPGTGTDRLAPLVPEAILAPNLTAALEEARLAAGPADIILFSPAFASFGQYQNEYERNDEFMSLVENI